MSNRIRNLVFIFILITGVGALLLTFQLANTYSSKEAEETRCDIPGQNHQVKITNGNFSPPRTEAKLCDTMTITNSGDKLRLFAFGEKDRHRSYSGISEKILEKGQSLKVTLNRAGEYNFHDHLQEELQASFVVVE